jgi:hypothetical protein
MAKDTQGKKSVHVSTKSGLTEQLTCPKCRGTRTKTHVRHLPVPEGYCLGEEFNFSCTACGKSDTVQFLPRSKSEL